MEGCAPAFRRKGRLAPGMDADVAVFDPHTVGEKATFANMNRPAEGMVHVLVNGVPVISGAVLDAAASPGRPIRRGDA